MTGAILMASGRVPTTLKIFIRGITTTSRPFSTKKIRPNRGRKRGSAIRPKFAPFPRKLAS